MKSYVEVAQKFFNEPAGEEAVRITNMKESPTIPGLWKIWWVSSLGIAGFSDWDEFNIPWEEDD